MFVTDPVIRLSIATTRSPRATIASQRCDPRNPAPPVMTIRRDTTGSASAWGRLFVLAGVDDLVGLDLGVLDGLGLDGLDLDDGHRLRRGARGALGAEQALVAAHEHARVLAEGDLHLAAGLDVHD